MLHRLLVAWPLQARSAGVQTSAYRGGSDAACKREPGLQQRSSTLWHRQIYAGKHLQNALGHEVKHCGVLGLPGIVGKLLAGCSAGQGCEQAGPGECEKARGQDRVRAAQGAAPAYICNRKSATQTAGWAGYQPAGRTLGARSGCAGAERERPHACARLPAVARAASHGRGPRTPVQPSLPQVQPSSHRGIPRYPAVPHHCPGCSPGCRRSTAAPGSPPPRGTCCPCRWSAQCTCRQGLVAAAVSLGGCCCELSRARVVGVAVVHNVWLSRARIKRIGRRCCHRSKGCCARRAPQTRGGQDSKFWYRTAFRPATRTHARTHAWAQALRLASLATAASCVKSA